MMRRLGLGRAVVTSSPELFEQSWYFQTADAIGFGIHTRTDMALGTRLGELRRVDRWHTAFDPSDAVDLVTAKKGEIDSDDP